MASFEKGMAFSKKFMPTVKRILQELLIEDVCESSIDRTMATDLLILRADDIAVACRMRDYKYFDRYGNEFTIRSRCSFGPTELDKIRDGWGDWLFYGFGDPRNGSIIRWSIIDLHAFRWYLGNNVEPVVSDKSNGDGTYFNSYDIRDFRGPVEIVKRSNFIEHTLELF